MAASTAGKAHVCRITSIWAQCRRLIPEFGKKAKDREIKHGAHWKQGSNLISWTAVKRRPKPKVYVPLKEVTRKEKTSQWCPTSTKGHLSRMVMVSINSCLHTTTVHWSGFPKRHIQVCRKNPESPCVYFHMLHKLFTYAHSDYEVNMNFYHIKGQHLKTVLVSISSHPLIHYIHSLGPCTRNIWAKETKVRKQQQKTLGNENKANRRPGKRMWTKRKCWLGMNG